MTAAERNISKEDIEDFFKNEREKIQVILDILSKQGQTLNEMAIQLNDLIISEPLQKKKDILMAAILSIYKQFIFRYIGLKHRGKI